MQKAAEDHKTFNRTLSDLLEARNIPCLLYGAGGCTLCTTCTYPDAPCRFPEKATSSMEGYGMVVSEVCSANNMPYYYGPCTITYVACCMLY